jgi:fucose permease
MLIGLNLRGPLVATALVADAGTTYSRYYLLTLSVSVFNLVFAGWAFWHYEAESATGLLSTIEQIASQVHNSSAQQQTDDPSQLTTMIKAFKSKAVLLGALFIFAYQGAEVSISGWVISFLIENRHGREPAVGYVSSGFWAGITVGRFVLSHPAHKIGEKFFVYGVIIGAIVFELLVWLVPNVVGEAVAVAIVGLFLGPIYPCATAVFSRAIARKDQVSGLSVISAFGSSGGAVAPLVTGILAQAVGTFVLHPIVLVLFTVMIVCWFGVPNVRKRMD